MGLVDTPMFGWIEVPDSPEEIATELAKANLEFTFRPSRYAQGRIDALECALDWWRRDRDV